MARNTGAKSPEGEKLWQDMRENLDGNLHPSVIERFIDVIEPASFDGKTLVLAVPNDYYQSWVQDNHLGQIKDAALLAHGSKVDINFAVNGQEQSVPLKSKSVPVEKKPARDSVAGTRTRAYNHLNSKFTFDNFVVGDCNNFAHAAAMAVAKDPGTAYNPLFIYGSVGLGKTHLLQAIGNQILGQKKGSEVRCLSSEAFLNEYISAIQERALVRFRRKYRKAGALLLDDVQFLAGKEKTQEEFFHTFNALIDARKQIVMTSDRDAHEIEGLQERLVSRFEWGLVTELEKPDYETRAAILRAKVAQERATVSDTAIDFIAKNITSDMRNLEGALTRVLAYSSLTGKQVTTESELKYLLKNSILSQELTQERIVKAVADHYKISVDEMKADSRARRVFDPRSISIYLCRNLLPKSKSSYPVIARYFGKTHATVMNSYKRVRDVDELRTVADNLAKDLRGEA